MNVIKLVKEGTEVRGDILRLESELLVIKVREEQIPSFQVGEAITGIFQNRSHPLRVIRISGSLLYLFFSIYERLGTEGADGRRVPRVPVQMKGFLMSHHPYSKKVMYSGDIQIVDLSILGLGFLSKDHLDVSAYQTALLQADLLPIKVEFVIRHKGETEHGFRYGGEFQNITSKHFQLLRQFVLTVQLAMEQNHQGETHAKATSESN